MPATSELGFTVGHSNLQQKAIFKRIVGLHPTGHPKGQGGDERRPVQLLLAIVDMDDRADSAEEYYKY